MEAEQSDLLGFLVGRWSPCMRALWPPTPTPLQSKGRRAGRQLVPGYGQAKEKELARQGRGWFQWKSGLSLSPWRGRKWVRPLWGFPAPLTQHPRSWFPAAWSLRWGCSHSCFLSIVWLGGCFHLIVLTPILFKDLSTQSRRRASGDLGLQPSAPPRNLSSQRPSSVVPNLPHSSPLLLMVTPGSSSFGASALGGLEQAFCSRG